MKQKQGHYNAEGKAKIPWRPSAASSDLLWKSEMSLRTKAGICGSTDSAIVAPSQPDSIGLYRASRGAHS
jgi:hypothetical protein